MPYTTHHTVSPEELEELKGFKAETPFVSYSGEQKKIVLVALVAPPVAHYEVWSRGEPILVTKDLDEAVKAYNNAR